MNNKLKMSTDKVKKRVKAIANKTAYAGDIVIIPASASLIASGALLSLAGGLLTKSGLEVGKCAKSKSYHTTCVKINTRAQKMALHSINTALDDA